MKPTFIQSLHDESYRKSALGIPLLYGQDFSDHIAQEPPEDPSSPSDVSDYHQKSTDEVHDFLLHYDKDSLLLPSTQHQEYRHWNFLGKRVWIDKGRHLLPLHEHIPIHPSPMTLIRAPKGFGASVLLSMISTIHDSNQSFNPSCVPWTPPLYPTYTGSPFKPRWIPCLPLHLDLKDVLVISKLSSSGMNDLSALSFYINKKMFSFANRHKPYFKETDNGMPILFENPCDKRMVNLLSRLTGCHLYITVDHINAFLYKAPPGRVHEYDLAMRRLLVEPLAAIMKQPFFTGCMLAAIAKSDAPAHVRAYDESGLGSWNLLQAPDITSHPTVSLLLGFRENEISALDAFFPTFDQSKSLMDQVREEHVSSLSLDLQETGYSKSYSMAGVLAILRRRTGQKDFDLEKDGRYGHILPFKIKRGKDGKVVRVEKHAQSERRQKTHTDFDDLAQSFSRLQLN